MFKSGFVSVIGRSNVGKSTLLNRVLGEKLTIISDKPQTTRNKIQLIYTDENMQAIFLDTPGIQTPKNKLGDYMLKVSMSTLNEVDVITYIVDTTEEIGKLDSEIIEKLRLVNTKIILLINKIDKIASDKVNELVEMYTKVGIFEQIIPISALNGDYYLNIPPLHKALHTSCSLHLIWFPHNYGHRKSFHNEQICHPAFP